MNKLWQAHQGHLRQAARAEVRKPVAALKKKIKASAPAPATDLGGAVGPFALRRQPKGVHKKGKQLQRPQLSEQAQAGAPGSVVAGCWDEGKEGQ